jgi:tripartite-type tricarboxylate transporter receptor subunit TctC
MRRAIHIIALAACTVLAAFSAWAQPAWPTKAVRVVVPGPAGSATDLVARIFTDAFARTFGQPFVVDNKPGANGIIGTEAAARSPNDGHTLLLTYAAAHVVNPLLYAKIPYDPVKDFAPIAQISSGGNLLIVRPSMPVATLQEFIAHVKSKPSDEFAYGSWGNGSGGHIAMEALKHQAGIALRHVPYRSTAAATQDVLSGEIPVAFSAVAVSLPFIRSGQLKALALSGPLRTKELPDVPTMTEQGVKFDVAAWFGLFAPAGTHPSIVERLNVETLRLLYDPEMLARWDAIGLTEKPKKTPAEFAATIENDLKDWGAVIRAANITLD